MTPGDSQNSVTLTTLAAPVTLVPTELLVVTSTGGAAQSSGLVGPKIVRIQEAEDRGSEPNNGTEWRVRSTEHRGQDEAQSHRDSRAR